MCAQKRIERKTTAQKEVEIINEETQEKVSSSYHMSEQCDFPPGFKTSAVDIRLDIFPNLTQLEISKKPTSFRCV